MRTTPLAALSLGLASACGGGLDVTVVDSAYQRPSNVAVYFTVDTDDGEPVPGLTAESFRIYEDGELVSIDESEQTIINPEVAAEHYTLLLVDMSGSVTESDQVPLIEQAAQGFTAQLQGYQKVAVYVFDGSEDIHRISGFTSGSGGIGRISGYRAQDPSTNLHGAIIKGTEVLNEQLEGCQTPLCFGTLVVFTDGTDRAHRVTYREMDNALDEVPYDVYAIGVGNEIDEGTLSGIGHSGYVLVQDAQAVSDAFAVLGEKIVGYTKRFYLLSYCSPARAGEHEVTVEAVHGELTGNATYRFDATGFGPRCNPSRPPPFPTGRQRIAPRRRPRGEGERITVRAGASASFGASANPEAGLE